MARKDSLRPEEVESSLIFGLAKEDLYNSHLWRGSSWPCHSSSICHGSQLKFFNDEDSNNNEEECNTVGISDNDQNQIKDTNHDGGVEENAENAEKDESFVSCSYVTGTSEGDRQLSQTTASGSQSYVTNDDALNDEVFRNQVDDGAAQYEASSITPKQVLQLVASVHGLRVLIEHCQSKESAAKMLQIMLTPDQSTQVISFSSQEIGSVDGQDLISNLLRTMDLVMTNQTRMSRKEIVELLSHCVHSLSSFFFALQMKLSEMQQGQDIKRQHFHSLLTSLVLQDGSEVLNQNGINRDPKVMIEVVEALLADLEQLLNNWRSTGLKADTEHSVLQSIRLLQIQLNQLLSLRVFDTRCDPVQSRLRMRRGLSATPEQMFLVSKLCCFQERLESSTVGLSLVYLNVCSTIWDMLAPIASVVGSLKL